MDSDSIARSMSGNSVNATRTESVHTAWPKPENACAKPVAKPREEPGHHLVSVARPGVQPMDWK